MERQNNNIIEGASLYALESRAEKIRSRYVGASVRRGESDRHKIGGTAFDSVSGGETTRVTGRYDETFAALNVKANTVDTLIEGKLSFTCQQDNFIMGGVYNETIIGGILITSGMSDGMTGGGGIRLTVPLDISLVGLIGLEEKFGAALADAVMIELSITHFEREFVSAIYNIGVWTRTGMMHATLATTAFSLLKVSVGVRSLTPGAGAAAEPGADAPVGSPTTGTLPSSTPPASAAGSGAVVRADGSVFIPQATGGYTRSYEVGKATATVLPTLDDVANAEDFASISRAAANLDNTADTATSATRHLDALDLIHEGSRADALADVADVEDVARIDELSDALDTAAPLDDTASPAAVQNAFDNGSINPQLLDNPDDLGDGNIYDTLNRGSDTDPQYNTLNRNSSDPQGYGTLNRGADTDAQGYGTLNGGSADNVDAQGYHSLERGSTDHLDAQGYHSLDRGSDNFLDPQGYHSLDRNPSTYLDGEPIYADVVRKTDASPVLRTDPADSGGKTRWGQMPLPDGAADELGGAADELGTAADDVDARTYDALRLQDPVDDPLTAGSPIPRADPSDAGGKTKWGQLPLPEGAADELGTAVDDLGAADDVDERLYATLRFQDPVNNKLKAAPDAPPASLNIDIYADDDLLGLPANAGAVEVSPAQLDVGDLDAIDDSSMFDGSYGAFGQTDATPAQKYSDAAVAAASDGDLLSPPPPPTRKDPRDVAPPVKIKASTYEDIFEDDLVPAPAATNNSPAPRVNASTYEDFLEDDLAPPAAATNNSPAPSAVDDGGGYAAVPDSTPLVDPSEIDDFSLDGVPDFHAGQEVTTFDEAKDLAASLKSYDFESEFDELHSYGQKLRGTQGERPNWQAASVVHQGEVKLNELVRSTLQGLDGGELVDLQPIEDLQAVTGRQQLMAFVEAAEASGDQQKLIDATNAVAAFDQQARQIIEATTLEAQRIAGLPIPMVDETVDAARLADALDEQVQAQMANSEWASAIERDPTKTVKVPESERIGYSHQVTALASASDALRAGEDPIARLDEEIIRLRDTIAQGGDPADNQAKIAAYQKIRDMVADTLQSPAFKREAQPVAPNAGAGAAAGRLDDAQPIPIPEEYPFPQLNNGAADWDVPVEESSHYMDIDDLPGAGGGASTTANDAVPAPTYSVGEEINAAGGGTDGASSINETADIFDDDLYGTVAPTSVDEVEPSEALSAADAAKEPGDPAEILSNPAAAQGDEGLGAGPLDVADDVPVVDDVSAVDDVSVVDDVPVEPVNPMDLDPNARVAPPKKRSARVAKLKQDQVRVSFSDQVEVRQIRLDGDGDELPPRRPLRRTTEELRSGATLHDSPDHLRRRELLPFDQLSELLAVPLTGARRSNVELKPDDLFTIQEVITLKDGQRQFETVQEILDATTPVTRTTIHKSLLNRFKRAGKAAELGPFDRFQFSLIFNSLKRYRSNAYRGGGTPRFLDRTDVFWRTLRGEGYSANNIALSFDMGWDWNAGRAADDLRDYLLDTNLAYKADFTAAGGDTSNLRLANYT